MAPIRNQKRYDSVVNEILQYLQMNNSELTVEVQRDKFITFRSINSEGGSFDQVTLPLSSQYLHTSYFRLFTGFQPSQEVKRFTAIAWEVLNIMKENFPSKLLLFQEGLEICKPVYLPMSSTEELRRQISCLLTLKEEGRSLTSDEIEDLIYTLQFAEKLNDQKAIGLCLEILVSQGSKCEVDEGLLQRIIARSDVTALQSNRMLANQLLQMPLIQQNLDILSLQSSESSSGGNMQALVSDKTSTSTRMCLFQLSESNDIDRVTQILNTLSTKSKESLEQMQKKYNLSHKLIQILKKYCNADYGFDRLSSKNGTFQYYLTKLMTLLASDYAVFLEILQSQTLDWLSQIIEEAIIYLYEQSSQGQEQSNYLYRFLRLSIDLLDLAVSKNFAEFIPLVRDNMRKIQSRFVKVIQKKDLNPLLQFFVTNVEEQHQVKQQVLSFEQLSQLKSLSEGLYSFTLELSMKLQRVEGLNETLFENHEDKYTRLFPVLAARGIKIKQHNEQHPTKFEQLPTFSGCEGSIDGDQENLSTNVYLKKKIEQGFKRVVNSHHQQLKPRNTIEGEIHQKREGDSIRNKYQ